MGTQTMTSGGGGGGRQSKFQSVGRQGSVYGLTLNEVQSHLGEPLHSMNLDEFLKNIFPAETSQPWDVDGAAAGRYASGLQRQGSISMSRAMSKRTVDEVWREIQRTKGGGEECSSGRESERHPTLGEMTLEDFLIKAGVVAEGPNERGNQVGRAGGFAQGAHWLQQYHQQQAPQSVMDVYVPVRLVPQPVGVGAGHVLDAAYQEDQVTILSPIIGTLSDTQTPGRKRGAAEELAEEKSVERRQKRMIKNRESAARSRARKQAYTNELENKVSRLEEENERLKKQKQLENMLYCVPPPEPKHQIRRTSSAPF